jgi:hypothetical protein
MTAIAFSLNAMEGSGRLHCVASGSHACSRVAENHETGESEEQSIPLAVNMRRCRYFKNLARLDAINDGNVDRNVATRSDVDAIRRRR